MEKNKRSSTKGAKPGLTSPGRIPGTGSITEKPATAQKYIHRRIVIRSARFVPEIAGDLP